MLLLLVKVSKGSFFVLGKMNFIALSQQMKGK